MTPLTLLSKSENGKFSISKKTNRQPSFPDLREISQEAGGGVVFCVCFEDHCGLKCCPSEDYRFKTSTVPPPGTGGKEVGGRYKYTHYLKQRTSIEVELCGK